MERQQSADNKAIFQMSIRLLFSTIESKGNSKLCGLTYCSSVNYQRLEVALLLKAKGSSSIEYLQRD